jgi:hypothetical protein
MQVRSRRLAQVARAPVQINGDEIGAMLVGAGDDLAIGTEHQARAVEDQIILAAHLIDEHQRPPPATRR